VASKLVRVLECLASEERVAVLSAIVEMVDGAPPRPGRMHLALVTGLPDHVRRLEADGLIRPAGSHGPAVLESGYELTDVGRQARTAIQIIAEALGEEADCG
jgi:hypothetical protein